MAEKQTSTSNQPFEALLSELDIMAKAIDDAGASDDKNIQENEDNEDEDDEYGDEQMGKSFTFKNENGEEIEAIDGTELVKSLMAKIEVSESVMAKALSATMAIVDKQSQLIKSLQSDVKKLGGTGVGRKAVLNLVEKKSTGELKKSQEDGITAEQFMAKAMQAQKDGKINSIQVSIAETYFNKGQQPPADLIAKVLS